MDIKVELLKEKLLKGFSKKRLFILADIIEKKITKEHLTNYLKHSYKIYKS